MSPLLYKYTFDPATPPEEIEAVLVLAIFAAESLHGESQVRLDAGHYLDVEGRTLVIDGTTVVGQDLNKLFCGFAAGEFGEACFRVERVPAREPAVVA